jgi:integrase/recombinase XerD
VVRLSHSPLGSDDPQVDAFLEMMAAERGASVHTLSAYRGDLLALGAYLRSSGRRFLNAQPNDLRKYLASIHKAKLGARSTARRLSSTRQFFQFLYREGMRADDPAVGLDRPRLPKPLPKYLTEDEVDALLSAAHDQPGPEGARGTALLELLYASGLRVSELVSLPIAAARNPSVFIVRGKGSKERMVPVGEAAQASLKSYLKVRARFLPKKKTNSPWLFPSSPWWQVCRRRVYRRTCCGIHSPRTCYRTVRICGPCSNCWVTAIFRPRKYIRTFSTSA